MDFNVDFNCTCMQKLEIRLLRTLRNTKHRLLVVSFKCKGESAVNPIIVLVHI